MTSIDAMRILQHASFYIFSTRVVGGPGKTMRGSVDVWQAMATLDHCRSEVLRTEMSGAGPVRDQEPKSSLVSKLGIRQNGLATLMLCC